MDKEISVYKRVLQHLTVSQNVRILHAIHKNIQPYAVKVSNIQPVFETFGLKFLSFGDFLKKDAKTFETEEIVNPVKRRRKTVIASQVLSTLSTEKFNRQL
ncbi:MAG: hypothetical protein LBE04_05215, partial [Prevotellaceae bacterium]|nr:hypothetical protein [Prevotellaceae bacterium]